jgi:kumamolisin
LATRLGDASPDQIVTLTIALRPQTPDAVDRALANARSAPLAPPLTPDDVALKIGPPQSTVDQVTTFFRSNGLTVASVARDRLSLQVSGSLGQIKQTLGVNQGIYRDAAGHVFRATSVDPSVPASIAGSIQAIFGLDTYPALKPLGHQAAPLPGSYTPSDIRTAYNVDPLLSGGFDGTGQTIGIVGCDTYLSSDLQGFNTDFSLPASNVTQVTIDQGAQGQDAETTLDLEWSHAIASGAALRFYAFSDASGCSISSLYDGINAVKADYNVTSVVSISLGACEQTYVTTNFLGALETAFGTMATQGQGVFVASGDQGAYACTDNLGNPTVGVSYPASSAYVTAVGGTSLHLNSDSTYQSESAWGDTCTDAGTPVACGTGGGKSGAIAEPSWQSGAAIPLPSTGGMRGVPDVALDADPQYGYYIYWTDPSCPNPKCPGFGGTSIAAPQWAGFAAMANQYTKRRLGQLSPLLYQCSTIVTRPASLAVYHDVTTGTDGSSPIFYSATPGWDFTTGWGSANAYHLVQVLATGTVTSAVSSSSAVSAMPQLTTGSHSIFLPIVYQSFLTC